MAKCKATNASGQPCQAQAIKGSEFCFTHDAPSAAARQAARKRGGLRRRVGHAGNSTNLPEQVKTIDDVLKVLNYALQESLPLENSVQRGRLIVAICGAFVEAIKTGELENRLAAIESALKAREVPK